MVGPTLGWMTYYTSNRYVISIRFMTIERGRFLFCNFISGSSKGVGDACLALFTGGAIVWKNRQWYLLRRHESVWVSKVCGINVVGIFRRFIWAFLNFAMYNIWSYSGISCNFLLCKSFQWKCTIHAEGAIKFPRWKVCMLKINIFVFLCLFFDNFCLKHKMLLERHFACNENSWKKFTPF